MNSPRVSLSAEALPLPLPLLPLTPRTIPQPYSHVTSAGSRPSKRAVRLHAPHDGAMPSQRTFLDLHLWQAAPLGNGVACGIAETLEPASGTEERGCCVERGLVDCRSAGIGTAWEGRLDVLECKVRGWCLGRERESTRVERESVLFVNTADSPSSEAQRSEMTVATRLAE
jgi:hypothetical protein